MPRNKIIILAIAFLLVGGALVYFFIVKPKLEKAILPSKEKTMEEILESLTAPSGGEKPEVSKEIIKSLTVPKSGEDSKVAEDILQSLTVPIK